MELRTWHRHTSPLLTGEITAHSADAVVLATGGYGNVYYLSTNAKAPIPLLFGVRISKALILAILVLHKFILHAFRFPGDYQSKLTLMSESLRNDGRCWVPKKILQRHARSLTTFLKPERDYYLERRLPKFWKFGSRRDAKASRAAKKSVMKVMAWGSQNLLSILDFADAIKRLGKDKNC